ncbi:hypothetical protein FRC12_007694 [Ceratobasidium sp. 428]|nr:hypothetical protein FRC12_007694 [Ceratobasidium sp. 428]
MLSSLRESGSKYPLVVMVLPSDSARGAQVLNEYREILKRAGCVLREVDTLVLALGGYTGTQTRYIDIWAKSRAFGLCEFERIVLIDSDMLPQVIHVLVIRCAYPTILLNGTPGLDVLCTPFQPGPDDPTILHYINSGLVVLTPSARAHDEVIQALHADPKVSTYPFVDQDFLAHYFNGRIKYLGYEFNALKPMRECHKDLWRDENVRNAHYVLKDKPWSIPESSKELEPQFLLVHSWWWDEWRKIESRYGGESWWHLIEPLVAAHSTNLPRSGSFCKLW